MKRLKILRLLIVVAGLAAIVLGLCVSQAGFVRLATLLSPDGKLEEGTVATVEGGPWVFMGFGLVLLAAAAWWNRGYRTVRTAIGGLLTCSHGSFVLRIVLLALFLRLAYSLSIEYVPIADWAHYHKHAVDLAEGLGYIKEGQPTSYYPVGWPFFLSILYRIFGTSYTVSKVANSVLGAMTCLLIFWLGRLYYNEKVARSAALLLAFFPSHVYFSAIIASEILFTFLFLVSLLLIEWAQREELSLRRVALAGLILGLANYVRSVPLFLPVFLVPLWWLTMRRFWRPIIAGIVLMTVVLVVLSPWAYRNYVRTGWMTLGCSNGAVAFWIGNREIPENGNKPRYAEIVEMHGGNPNAGYWAGLRYIAKRPMAFIGRGFKKVLMLYQSDRIGFLWLRGSNGVSKPIPATLMELLLILADVFYLSTLALALTYLFMRIIRRWKAGDLLLIFLLGYWTLLHFCICGLYRHHFPIVPIFILFACEGYVRIRSGWNSWKQRRVTL